MLLAIDCGNTNTVFSIWNGTEFLATWRTSTEWQRTADQYFVWLSTLMKMRGIEAEIDRIFGKYVVEPLNSVLFWKIGGEVPLIAAWLLFGAVFFTLRMKLVNFRLFGHAISLVRGTFLIN